MAEAAVAPPASPATAEVDPLRESRAADILHLLFGLKHQRLLNDYSCAISEQILMHGRMYVTEAAVCFYSNIFGKETRKILPFDRMLAVRKRMAAYVIPAIEFVMAPKSGGEKHILFTSFFGSFRDDCYELTLALLRKRHPHLVQEDGAAAHTQGHAQAAAAAEDKKVGTAASAAEHDGGAAGTSTTQPPVLPGISSPRPSPTVRGHPSAEPPSTTSAQLMDREERLRKRSGSLPNMFGGSFSESGAGATPTSLSAAKQPRAAPTAAVADGTSDNGQAAGTASHEPASAAAVTRVRAATALPSSELRVEPPAISDAAREVAFASPGAGLGGRTSAGAAVQSPAAYTPEVAPPIHPSTWSRLSRMKVLVDVVFPVPVREFHAQCIADDAPYSIGEFHQNEGDYNITTTPWVRADDASASASRESGGQNEALVTRTVRLRMPLDPGPFMPKETAVEKVQRYTQYSGPVLIVDTFAKSLDVPYGDYFVTEDTWVVAPVDMPLGIAGKERPPQNAIDEARLALAESTSQPADSIPNTKLCRVLVLMYVTFSKSTMFKSRIVAKTEESMGEFYNSWHRRVANHLRANVLARAGIQTVDDKPSECRADADVMDAAAAPRSAVHSAPAAPRESAPAAPPARAGAASALPVLSPHGTGGVVLQDFISPTMAAALSNPSIQIARDDIMRTWMSPQAAAEASKELLLRQYSQLFAAHEALISQLRQLQHPSTGVHAPRASAAESHSPPSLSSKQGFLAATFYRQSGQMQIILVVFCLVLALFAGALLSRQFLSTPAPLSAAPPVSTNIDTSALSEEVWQRLQQRLEHWQPSAAQAMPGPTK